MREKSNVCCLPGYEEDGKRDVNVYGLDMLIALLLSAMALRPILRAVLLLTTHANETRTKPHHELGECAVRLLLGA
jgi:hypothetical protein